MWAITPADFIDTRGGAYALEEVSQGLNQRIQMHRYEVVCPTWDMKTDCGGVDAISLARHVTVTLPCQDIVQRCNTIEP